MSKKIASKFRPLPMIMVALVAIFGFKVNTLWQDANSFFVAAPAHAQSEPEKAAAENASGEKDSTADAEQAAGDDAVGDEAADDEVDVTELSRGEIELLQDLATRRKKLDSRERGLDMRERVIQVTEGRVTKKLAEIKKIQADIQSKIAQYDDVQKARLDRMVKVYESMKPKDAAKIFNTLDLEVLLPVAERMKAAKIAGVMSKMDAQAAKTLTTRLSTREPLEIGGR